MAKPASDKQKNFIRSLIDDKQVPGDLDAIKNQVEALDVKQASAWIDRLLALPRRNQHQLDDVDGQKLAEAEEQIPAGRYAIVMNSQLCFIVVDKPTKGKWAGYTFVATLEGDNRRRVKNPALRAEILGIILLTGVEAAAREYGHHRNECGFCRHGLTDAFSRYFGVGPVCRRRHGMPISEAAFRKERPHLIADLDAWLAEDIRRHGGEDGQDPNEAWANHKNEFAAREREQEEAAFAADPDYQRFVRNQPVTPETPPHLA